AEWGDVLIEIRLLGRFSARRGEEEIPPGAFRQRLTRSLVQVLLTRRGSYVSREALTQALWPQRPPADPAANLRVLVNLARRALGQALESGAAAAVALGDPEAALSLAELAASRDPLRESAQLLYVSALAASGDVAAALATLEAFRRRFADELGIDLSAEAAS